MQFKPSGYAHNENGNILFLILLAVVLFAALSYAVTSSMRGGGKDASGEKDTLVAANIVQYATSMESAVTRMRLTGGCRDTDISFETTQIGYNFAHTPAVSDACKVFSPAGGGIAVQAPTDWFDMTLPGVDVTYNSWFTTDVGIQNVGTAKPELLFLLYIVKKGVCQKINEKLGIPGSTPPSNPISNAAIDFQGVYAATATDTIGTTGGAASMTGQPTGCLSMGGDPETFVFYHTILAK